MWFFFKIWRLGLVFKFFFVNKIGYDLICLIKCLFFVFDKKVYIFLIYFFFVFRFSFEDFLIFVDCFSSGIKCLGD